MSQVISNPPARDSYSADVRIELHAADRIFRPSHTAADYLLFREPQTIPSTTARLIVTIDGTPRISILRILPQAMPSDRILVEIIRKADAP